MAEVYLSKLVGAQGVNKFVAIKRILPQYSENDEFNSMFKEEAKIAVNISHSNVVPIYDFGEENKRLYLVMEYVPGKNVRQILNTLKKAKDTIPLPFAVAIINDVAKGLDHAHKCFDRTTGRPLNIIHRDVSPQNIILSFDGEVKLLDFGIAKAESKIETTRAGTLKGKFGYMSPEQAEGLELDARTDIFSLGIVLWEILADARLFMAKNEVQTIRKIRDCVVPSLTKSNPEVTQDLDNIVQKALARDRNIRYQTAGDLHKDLNKFLNRHYPDFTHGDLGAFMKRLYNDEIVDLREKMIEYAALGTENELDIGWDQLGDEDQTRILDDAGNNFYESSLTFDPMAEINKKTENNSIAAWQTDNKSYHSRITGAKIPKGAYATTVGEKSHFMRNFMILLMMVFGAAYYLKTNPQIIDNIKVRIGLKQSSKSLASKLKEKESNFKSPEDMKPDEVYYKYHINSSPPGAAIFINGQETGFLTPGRVQVKPNTQFTLSLKRDGYFPYTQKLLAGQDGQQFQATLLKASFGFVTVRVVPSQAVLYINGQKLNEQPPLENYAIPANERIHIRAVNPITGASAEKVINIRQDTHRSVSLFLKKRENSPTNNRQPSNY
jgi:serine/threonine-protein kinase